MSTIPVTWYRSAVYSEEHNAEIDPREYVDWCEENGDDPKSLDALRQFLYEYAGHVNINQGVYEESEFKDFERADYGVRLAAAAAKARPVLTNDDLKAIIKAELEKEFRPGRAVSLIQMDHEMTSEESDRFRELLDGAKITVTI